jgi:hypothetical protein
MSQSGCRIKAILIVAYSGNRPLVELQLRSLIPHLFCFSKQGYQLLRKLFFYLFLQQAFYC